MDKIRIVITDDDSLIVSLLKGFLQTEDNIDVLFTANSGTELLNKLSEETIEPNILLLDLKMDGMDGVAVTEHLKVNYPDIKVIVISSHYQKSFMGFMIKTGVSAFLPKGVSPQELLEVINGVYKQGFYFKEDQLAALRGQISVKAPKPSLNDDAALSDREMEVLRLICQQKTAKEIGEILFITQRTAEGHKNNLFVKTGARNIAGLVIYAMQQGIIRAEELPII
ncbi:MAG: two-component system response regulator [Flavobacterium sp. MedPE-SWcel]|uniref:response regulator transcription factor n=1 Tax=uncultured Flavobacterium sp. TaxID=165435 RepID=UPI000913A03F|nr:response regulator transcription factor [uncultured Flavobacterium sp.]OIQ21089.1 MAG: two-component system response regulator [Flavobacterium sp. MedPE-SWcel]